MVHLLLLLFITLGAWGQDRNAPLAAWPQGCVARVMAEPMAHVGE